MKLKRPKDTAAFYRLSPVQQEEALLRLNPWLCIQDATRSTQLAVERARALEGSK